MKLVLASGSPRRQQLLRDAGYDFWLAAPGIEEETDGPVETVTQLNAQRKVLAAAARFPDACILGADTLVSLGGTTFGKPTDMADALRIIRKLNGQTHDVVTSVSILSPATPARVDRTVTSQVTFQNLDDAAILEYLERAKPLDKAGAYAAQENGLIAFFEGSFTNVIGLPMETVIPLLAESGIHRQRMDHEPV